MCRYVINIFMLLLMMMFWGRARARVERLTFSMCALERLTFSMCSAGGAAHFCGPCNTVCARRGVRMQHVACTSGKTNRVAHTQSQTTPGPSAESRILQTKSRHALRLLHRGAQLHRARVRVCV